MAASTFDGYQLSDPDTQAQQTALLRAKKNCRKRNKGEHKSSFTMPLNVQLCAGQVVSLQGFGPEFDGNWIIEEAKHVIGRTRPSETTIEIRKALDGY
jgi:hypothetical protein